ncbi:hypothetical protein CPB85DRAFT_1218909 [Mucidula mucida]|nr:hypothetical protein CPB85DRAFT_1218909 [Mucidula mucida]
MLLRSTTVEYPDCLLVFCILFCDPFIHTIIPLGQRPRPCLFPLSPWPQKQSPLPPQQQRLCKAPNGKAAVVEKTDTLDPSSTSKPDKKVYDAEQERIKNDIDALQAKLNAVRDKISLATKPSGNERRNQLRAELDGLRGQQTSNKASRGKILDQVKALQENIQKKIKDIQAAQSKIPFKTVAEVDARIKTLEKQVESGNMKLADEKRAVQEISTCKRNRRTVEGFQSIQDSIEADRKTIEDLRTQLDDPEFKATSDRFDTIKAELDELKKEGDEAYAGRSKLFEERDDLQNQLNTLWTAKRESSQQYRDNNDRYWTKVNEDRARRAERAKAQRAAEEAEKKREVAQRLREEAELPAFQAQIEDCQTLIDFFSGKSTTVTLKSASAAKAEVAGVPKLEIRQVDAAPEGLVVRKKKGEEQDNYFVASKGKGKNKKGTPKPQPEQEQPSTDRFVVSLANLSALMEFSIPPPTSQSDVPRVIEDLTTKKNWFQANQDRVTKENIAKAEAQIQKLAASAKELGTPEVPLEPSSTPKSTDIHTSAVPSEEVDAKLEAVEEQEIAADS